MSNFYIFKKIEYIPNAITLGIWLKDQLKKYIDFCGNRINLKDNINEITFINKVINIYNQKNIINVN
jgi:hypothetical protein